MAYGTIDALNAAGCKAKIVGANGLADAVAHIEKGTMLAGVDFSAFKISCIATRAALRHLKGEPVPASVTVPSLLIDRSNFAAWKVPVEQRSCPAWEEIVR